MSYGVGETDSFGYKVGRSVKFIEVNVSRKIERNERLEAVTIAEMEVAKRQFTCLSFHFTHAKSLSKDMLNGAGMLHGGCIAYLIDM